MARSTPELINALRVSVQQLDAGAQYEWGHMGRCNCGHLVQAITTMSSREIVEAADFAMDEWSEHAKDYCAGTGQKVDQIFLTLQQFGFGYQDVIHLENLTDPCVLSRVGTHLRRNCVTDVTLYMSTLADLLEEEVFGSSLQTPLLSTPARQTSALFQTTQVSGQRNAATV